MNNSLSTLSGSLNGRFRGRGIPKACWCGHVVVELLSKTDDNPFQRFFRCSYVAGLKLKKDKHVFKWIDEALINEVEFMDRKIKSLEEEVKDMKKMLTDGVEFEKMRFENLEIGLERRLNEKMEIAISELANLGTKKRMWKTMCLVFVLGLLTIVGCSYLFGHFLI